MISIDRMAFNSNKLHYAIIYGSAKTFKNRLNLKIMGACKTHNLDLKCQPNLLRYKK
jgi:hypothetical protein